MTIFEYHPDIAARYPNIVGGVVVAQGMSNGPSPERLLAAYKSQQQATLARVGNTLLSDIPSLSAWRAVFRDFGVDPTQYRSAAEALLRRLTKKGDIPSVNLLVDLCNMVSIRYMLPVAIFDARCLEGKVTVRFADGSEEFMPLGEAQVEHPEPGEVVFSDEANRVVARRWCWRQSQDSAAQPDTAAAIITLEAQHPLGREHVESALQDLLQLLPEYAGGSFEAHLLDAQHPAL